MGKDRRAKVVPRNHYWVFEVPDKNQVQVLHLSMLEDIPCIQGVFP